MKIIFIVLIGLAFAFGACGKLPFHGCGCDGGPSGDYPRPYYINSYCRLSNQLLVNDLKESGCFRLFFIYDSVFDATISYNGNTEYRTFILKNQEQAYTSKDVFFSNLIDSFYNRTSYGTRFEYLQKQNRDIYNITEPAIGGAILDTIKQINLYMKNDKPTNTADSELCVNAYFTILYQSFNGYMGRKLDSTERKFLNTLKTESLVDFNQTTHPYCRNGHTSEISLSDDLYSKEGNQRYTSKNWMGIQLKPLASYQQPISKMRIEVITTSGKVCSGIYTKE